MRTTIEHLEEQPLDPPNEEEREEPNSDDEREFRRDMKDWRELQSWQNERGWDGC